MKKSILFFLLISVTAMAQVITPFSVRKTITQKGGILYLSNTSSRANPANVVQNEMPPAGTGYDNTYINGYVDIDADATTFMSSSDKISIPSGDPSAYSLCSEISWAGLYWGGAINSTNANYAARNQVKLKINSGSYLNLSADYLKDNAIGFKTYHCFKDITAYVDPKGLNDTFTVANVVNDIGAKNLFGGWTIVIVYKDNTTTMKNLTVFDGLANVSAGTYSTVDIPISGFQTPLSGPVNFQLGMVVYDGDRSLTGDQLLFKGASTFVNLSDAIHPSTDMFNSTLSRNGVLTTQRNPSYNNTLGYDANIFNPDNTTKNYIGNNSISAVIRQTTGGETFLTQVVTSAIDVYEPDLRSAVTVENITNPGATVASPGDILEYTVSGLNIGSDPAINTYITDKIEGNAFYVPNSISIIEGPNVGPKTDAAGDDQAEYIAATKTVKVRIGTGANTFQGGSILNSPTGIDHTLIKFRVQISSDCVYMYCDNVVDNSAQITGTGNISGSVFNNASNPGVFDANGCAISGTTTTPVNITGCSAPTVTVNSPICIGGSINLSATSSPSATYLWTGPNGFTSTLAAPVINNVTAANAGTYTANVYVTGTACHFVYPIVVEVNIANAGQDLTGASTCGLTSIALAGNNPAGSTGEWTIVSGTGGNFGAGHTSTSSVATDTFYGVAGNTYVLRWTLTPTGCAPTTDDITITFHIPPTLAALSGASLTCNNSLNVAITGGTSPYTLAISNGVGTVTGYVSAAAIAVNPITTTTYTLSSVVDANGCSAASISPSTYQVVVSNSMGTGTITANNAPVFTNSVTSALSPSVGASSSNNTDVWSTTGNIYTSNDAYATQTSSNTGTTTYLYVKGFGFNIPVNAVVDGIVVTVEKKSSGGTISDSRISLLDNTTNLGTNKSITGTWPTSDVISTYGSATDVWGTNATSLTPTIINSANFGFRYRVNYGTANAIAYVDHATMTLYYHVGANTYCDTDSAKTFTVSGYTNATTYTWTPPTGATITSGQGTATATVNFNGAGQAGNYTLSVTPSNSCGFGTPATLSLPVSDCANGSLSIMGNVYKDINGSVSPNKVDGTGVGSVNGTQMYVTLVKTNGTDAFVQTVPVGASGAYAFTSGSIAQNNTYTVTLSTTNYTSGITPTPSLPAGCSNNGEIRNNITNSTTGNDGTIDGRVAGVTFASNNNITNVNFGIKIPTAPVATNDATVTNEDTPVSVTVTSNDTDVDGTVSANSVDLNTTTVGIQNSATNTSGTWSVNSSGVLTYTPTANFNGTATLSYKVNDNDNLTSNAATVTITVNPVNDAPVALTSSATATENAAYSFTAGNFNYSDQESNPVVSITIASLPNNGTLTINGVPVIAGQTIAIADISNLIFTPNPNEYGSAYTSFTFSVNDANLGSTVGTMTIDVTHVAGPPLAVNDTQSFNQDTTTTLNIVANDVNVDGTVITSSVDLDPLNPGQQTTYITGEGVYTVDANGILTFVPATGFYGTTTPISYTVLNTSSALPSNEATVTFTVLPTGAPVAVSDLSITTAINTTVVFNVTTNDTANAPKIINPSRVDLDPATPGIQQSFYVAGQGQFFVDINGEVSFTPDWNFSGITTIYYTVKDSQNLVSNAASITVTTVWANTAPFAIDDFATTNEDTTVTLSITTNDYDLDTTHGNSGVINVASVDLDPYTAGVQTTFTVADQGTFTVNNLGVVTFVPVLNFNGTVTPVEYVVNDSDATLPVSSNNGFIYVTITSVNDAPVIVNDTNSPYIAANGSATFSITANDSDVDGTLDCSTIDLDPFTPGIQYTFSVLGQGNYSVDASGNITFTYTGLTPIGALTPIYYVLTDNSGTSSNIGTISITILAGTPTAVADSFSTNEDAPVSYDVSANDTDTNGITVGLDPSTVALVGTLTTAAGTWSITDPVNNPGEITFTPAANFVGTATINYTITDLDGNVSNQATLTVTVNSINDAPSFTKGANQTLCANSLPQSITGWATAISPGPANESTQTVSFIVTNNLNSLFAVQPAISSTGVLTYSLAANQTGTATVSVQLQDNGGTANGGADTSATQTFTIVVTASAVGGTVAVTTGSSSVCTGTNSTTMTLTGNTGTRQWQSSTDNNTFTNIGGSTGASYTATNLSATTYYRVFVTSGTCTTTSNVMTLTVSPTSVAGSITGAATVCSGTNSTTLSVGGNTGNIQWQSASTLAGTYTAISGATAATYTATDLVATTYYKAVSTSGACASATTAAATVTVNAPSVAGTISGSTTVCANSNSTVLTVSGHTGTVQWQSSADNTNFTNIFGATNTTYTATNLAATTYYQAVVTSGLCASATTSSVNITVNSPSVAGTVSGSTTVCANSNSAVISLSGNTGAIQWQSSSDNTNFTNISGATSDTYTATNLAATTYYQAVVSSGVCASATTASATITVNAPSAAGTVSGSATVCTGTNSSVIGVSGHTGAIQWQSSTDNTNFTNISGATNATYTATNLVATTYYQAVITSGVCASATTSVATVTVNTPSVAGSISGAGISVCGGTNSTTLTLSGQTGTVQWQSSADNTSFTDILGATNATYTATDISTATYYQAVVTNGQCTSETTAAVSIGISPLLTFYADTDGDGFGDLSSATQSCVQPTNYVSNNTDCDDANASIWRSAEFFDDADADGYAPNTVSHIICYGATTPAGYVLSSANLGVDCNDIIAAINPGHVEVLYNGIDDNCDGNLDEGNYLVTQVIAPQCATTLAAIGSLIYADIIWPASGYRFKVINNTTNEVQYFENSHPWFALTMLASYDYVTTYNIAVELQVGGVWLGYYGTACNVTTPVVTSVVGQSQIISSQCGATLPAINSVIYTDAISSATGYRFRITDVTPGATGTNIVQVKDRSYHWFTLPMLSRYNYGSTYMIEVAVKTTGGYTGYGNPCYVYTPAVPALVACGAVIARPNSLIFTTYPASITQYRYQLTKVSDQSSVTFDRSINWFTFRYNVPGYSPATVYSVRIAVMSAGRWSPYGDACEITSPAIARTDGNAVVELEATAFPNPFSDLFRLTVSSSIDEKVTYKVYDMLGKLIETEEVLVAELETRELGVNYPAGVYNIIVTQGEEVKTLRVIKR